MRRRSLLVAGGIFAGTTLAGAGSRSADEGLATAVSRTDDGTDAATDTQLILPDTVHETPLHVIDAPRDGPTAMIFGGVHGDEYNGIDVAHEVSNWAPDAGTLVVVPETNREAVENDRREGNEGDLNRHFPPDQDPTSELARGVWDAVERHRPDVVLDLHRSLGIYGVHQQYVGQVIFHSPDANGSAVADYLDDVAVPWYMPLHEFSAVESSMQRQPLFHATHRELDATSYLFETTNFLLDREAMNRMTRLATAKVLELHGLIDSGDDR